MDNTESMDSVMPRMRSRISCRVSTAVNFVLTLFLLILFCREGWNILQKYRNGKTYIQVLLNLYTFIVKLPVQTQNWEFIFRGACLSRSSTVTHSVRLSQTFLRNQFQFDSSSRSKTLHNPTKSFKIHQDPSRSFIICVQLQGQTTLT